jgi:hypothetical protein
MMKRKRAMSRRSLASVSGGSGAPSGVRVESSCPELNGLGVRLRRR